MPSSPSRSARPSTSPGPDRPAGPGLLLALLVLALAGMAVAIDLWIIHWRAHSGGGPSFCDFSEHVSCEKVALSRYSSLLGVPLAAWGALTYLAMALLAGSGLVARRRGTGSWPAGLAFALAAFLTAFAVGLLVVSEVLIRSLCVMCLASWTISAALLAVSWGLARRAGGIGAALRADLAAVRARPALPGAGIAVLGAAAVGLLAYHAGRTDAAPGPQAAAPGAATPAPPPPVGPPGSVIVYEFSDYLCPVCAREHFANKPRLAARPDVRMVRRFFPLDNACNRIVTRAFHVGACELARAGVCAEAQGRFEAFDDAAFANQEENLPLDDVARRAGLDVGTLRACMQAPTTAARIAADIEAAIAAGVHATPSYQTQGQLFEGRPPPILQGAR